MGAASGAGAGAGTGVRLARPVAEAAGEMGRQLYTAGELAASPMPARPEVGRCTLTPPDPQLKRAWYPGGFDPLNLSSENPVSKCAFQTQLAPLQHGGVSAQGAQARDARG